MIPTDKETLTMPTTEATVIRELRPSAAETDGWLKVHWEFSYAANAEHGAATCGSGTHTRDSEQAGALVAAKLAEGASEVRITRTRRAFVPASYLSGEITEGS
jgi:hypothetical protein